MTRKNKLLLNILLIVLLTITLSILFSCEKDNNPPQTDTQSTNTEQDEEKIDYSQTYFNIDGVQIPIDANSQNLGNIIYTENLTIESFEYNLVKEEEQVDTTEYSVEYLVKKEAQFIAFDKEEELIPGEYVVLVKYKEKELRVSLNVLKATKDISIDATTNKTTWEIGDKKTTFYSSNTLQYRYIAKQDYDQLEQKTFDNIISSSQVYCSSSVIDIGTYYVFGVIYENEKYKANISNLVEINVVQSTKLIIDIEDEDAFIVTSMTYEEGIMLNDIEFDENLIDVTDKNGNLISGTFKWKNANEIIDCGTLGAYIEFIPDDSNYASITKFVTFNDVIKPIVVEKPKFGILNFTYDGVEKKLQLINQTDLDKFIVIRDKKEIAINDGNNIIESLINADEYIYKIQLKDSRNYKWSDGNNLPFEVTFLINKGDAFIEPTNINASITNGCVRIKVSTTREDNVLYVSEYISGTFKAKKSTNTQSEVQATITVEKGNDNFDYIVISNIAFEGDSADLYLDVSSLGFNFKNLNKTICVTLNN